MPLSKRASDAQDTSLPRRNFLRNSLLLALPAIVTVTPVAAAVMSSPLPALAMPDAYTPPSRTRGSKVLSVRSYGALGNGTTDDTNAFQSAINALPSTGGTIDVPAGTYMIDAVKAVKLRSNMHLRLASGALLKAKGNSEKWSNVLSLERVSNVEISGGEIEGERDRHQGTTGQWGHGIVLRGASHVTVRDILISKCWGDGICMGCAYPSGSKPSLRCDDIVISNIASTDNRRQGMSIGQANNVKVYDSEFSYTNGLAPGCGIDIEPDVNYPGTATNVRIENCSIHHNQGNGIQVYKKCQGTTITKCTIERNSGYGVLTIGAVTGTVTANHVTSNSLQGMGFRSGSSGFTASGNDFYNNGRKFRTKDLPKLSSPMARTGNVLPRHTEINASQSIAIKSNLYYDK